MNQYQVDQCKLQGRIFDDEAFQRLSKNNKKECIILQETHTNEEESHLVMNNLANDTLLAIQEDYAVRLSRYNTESFALKTKIKKIDRILKLRKKPILDE